MYQNSPLSIDHNPKIHTNNSMGTYYIINSSFKVSNTDLGNLFGNFDWIWHIVWKFINFTAPLILYEINFGWFQNINCHFNNFYGFEFWFLGKFHTWKCQKFPSVLNSELFKWWKWLFFGLQNDQNWFHVKYEWQNNHEISTLCIPN